MVFLLTYVFIGAIRTWDLWVIESIGVELNKFERAPKLPTPFKDDPRRLVWSVLLWPGALVLQLAFEIRGTK